MIEYVRGELAELTPAMAVVDCNGVGYAANISLNTYTAIQNKAQVRLYVYESIREDAWVLFGFATFECSITNKALEIDDGNVAIVAGFQGVSPESKDITTMGRGGSDTTAVALAAALNADACEIYTDVDGIYTADPRLVSSASRIQEISSEEMLELAASGSKILHLRAVEYARRFGVKLHVRSSFTDEEGTWVIPNEQDTIQLPEGQPMEQPIVAGVAHDTSEAKVTIIGVPDIPGKAAEIFKVIADAQTNIDMIVQNPSRAGAGATDISFTVPLHQGKEAIAALRAAQERIGFEDVAHQRNIGKISLIGAGMRSNPGVSATFFDALHRAGANIDLISTSEIRISVVTAEDKLQAAVKEIHSAFGLDAEEEATVHGGTGR